MLSGNYLTDILTGLRALVTDFRFTAPGPCSNPRQSSHPGYDPWMKGKTLPFDSWTSTEAEILAGG